MLTSTIIALAILCPPTHTIETSPLASELDYSQTSVIVPEGQNPATTPVVKLDGVWVPEESPEGGHPNSWADNSPTYSDGWMLLVDDSTTPVTVIWIAPKFDPTHTDLELEA